MRQGEASVFVSWLGRLTLAASLVMGLSTAALADCDPGKPPEAGHNVWYCANDSDTVVVFVHGLHSDNVTAWKSFEAKGLGSGSYWPGLVLADDSLRRPSVYLAGFYTEMGGTEYSMADAANELFSALSTPAGGQPSVLSRKSILFVAHSLGGIIVRDVLVRNTQAFAGKRVGLLLVASPSYGSHYADALGSLASVARQRLVQELAIGSPFLRQLDDDFKRFLLEQSAAGGGEVVVVGKELVENQFVDLGAGWSGVNGWLLAKLGWGIEKVYRTRVVEEDSAARYFGRGVIIPKSDHFTIARPSGINDDAHRELVLLYNRMQAAAAPTCEPPAGFRLVLDVSTELGEMSLPDMSPEFKATLPQLRLLRVKPDGTLIAGVDDRAARDPVTGRHSFAPGIPFPCPGESFRAKLSTVPVTSYLGARVPEFTDLCFRRSATQVSRRSAFLRCTHPGNCRLDTETPGLAEACSRTGWHWPSMVTAAYAQGHENAAFWVAPSLATLMSLPADERPGYAEFSVRSEPVAGIAGANGVSFGLTVNGVPIYFDGMPSHSEVIPFNSASGIRYTFGIENLGFTGGHDGHERLALEIRYWKDAQLLKTARLERTYVSYRHAKPERIEQPGGDVYEWTGYFRPAAVQNRYEVMIGVAQKKDGIVAIKSEFDAKKGQYEGKLAVGVIRPPRSDNPVYGLTLGLKLPSEQVLGAFPEKQARALCRWLVGSSGVPKWMRDNAYLYEFPAEFITEEADRGRMRAHCRKV